MKKATLTAIIAAICGAAFAGGAYDVRAYGAKGDGATKDTAAIQAAIDAANAAGGGEVFFGAGTYVSGSIYLKSNVDFHLGPGATLKGSPDKADYNRADAFPQNKVCLNESSYGAHLIMCLEQQNVTIRGPGKIDGNSAAFLIEPRTGKPWGYNPKLSRWSGQADIPFRPSQMLCLVESRNLRITDLELENSTYWNVFIWGCEQVAVRGCYIHNEFRRFHTHNGDGIDIDCSRFVTVSDCRIATADDCITLRASGKKLKERRDCAFITIDNCTLSTPCNCVRAGVGEGRVHDVVLSNITVHDARTAINFVSSWDRNQLDGVDFRNIRFMNWTVDCEILFHLYGGPLAKGVTRSARMRELFFEGFSGRVTRPSTIAGCSAETPIEDIRFRNIDVDTFATVSNARCLSVEGGSFRLVEKDAPAEGEVFPIACWTFQTQERARDVDRVVRDWKDLGITHPMSPSFGEKSDKSVMDRMLALCDREGLHLIVHDDRVHLVGALRAGIEKDDSAYRRNVEAAAKDWAAHPSFYGFHLYDEPRQSHNAAVFRAAKVIREVVPGKQCFLNLLPWYDWIGKLTGAKECAPYLDMMAKESGLDLLGYDLYDHMSEDIGETRGLDYYFGNLREWLEWTVRNPGKRYWVTQLCSNHSSRVVGDPADYRWQLSTAAAMGAKGVMWYYPEYNPSPEGTLGNVMNHPIDIFGERTEYFGRMAHENRLFQKWYGSEFMRLTVESAALVNCEHGGLKEFKGSGDVLYVRPEAKKRALVSFFRDAQGAKYMAIVNLERRRTTFVRVAVGDGVKPLQFAYSHTYEKRGLTADPVLAKQYGQPTANVFNCHFAPGQLMLFKLGR